jgi:hypothetical protein
VSTPLVAPERRFRRFSGRTTSKRLGRQKNGRDSAEASDATCGLASHRAFGPTIQENTTLRSPRPAPIKWRPVGPPGQHHAVPGRRVERVVLYMRVHARSRDTPRYGIHEACHTANRQTRDQQDLARFLPFEAEAFASVTRPHVAHRLQGNRWCSREMALGRDIRRALYYLLTLPNNHTTTTTEAVGRHF